MIDPAGVGVLNLAEIAKAIRELGDIMGLVRQNLRSYRGLLDDETQRRHVDQCAGLLDALVGFKESPSAFLYSIKAAGGKDLDQLTDEELKDRVVVTRIAADAAKFSRFLGDMIERQQQVFLEGWIQGGDAFLLLRETLAKRRDLLAQLQALDAEHLDPEAVREVGRAYKTLIAQLDDLLEDLRRYVAEQRAAPR